MCGIAGFLDFRAEGAPEVLARMGATLIHRGPDDHGTWLDPEAGVGLAHRRLSIVDLSPLGHQPMHSHAGRYVVVYNGEIYNFRELRAELEAASPPAAFAGHSDTEVLLAAIERWGLDAAVGRCIGMFAFALWDRAERTLHLVRDRLGIKPLYYGWNGGAFLFGSELKALRAHPAFEGEVDRGALALLLRHGYVPAPWSIHRGIRKLPPGCALAVRAGGAERPEPAAYWTARDAAERGARARGALDTEEAMERLDALLRDAVAGRMIADVPLGAFLSGGIDSSLVVSLMQAQSPRPVRTFSIGFAERDYDESPHARAVAERLGCEHTELAVSPREAMEVIPRLPALYDEPFADSSQIPTFLVSQLARRHVTVSLSGDGGDELFAGYNRYLQGRWLWRGARGVPAPLRRAGAAVLAATLRRRGRGAAALRGLLPRRMRQSDPTYLLHKLVEVLPLESPSALYQGLLSYWADPASVVIGASEPSTPWTDDAPFESLGFADAMMYLDQVTYLPDDILAKVDRASMGVSLEARVPILDHRVVELAWEIPLELKLRGGGKWILKQLLGRYLPRPLVDRPKMGFSVPVGVWLRGPLRDWAESLLDERRLRAEGFLRPEPIREIWSAHLADEGNWQFPLWSVLMFQAWLGSDGRNAGLSA